MDVVGLVGVVNSSAGHVEVGDGPFLREEAVGVLADGLGVDEGSGCDDVLFGVSADFDFMDQLDVFFVAEDISPCGLEGVVILRPLVEDVVVDYVSSAESRAGHGKDGSGLTCDLSPPSSSTGMKQTLLIPPMIWQACGFVRW